MVNLGSILKSRDITLPTKVHLVKAMVFPVVMYGCESWTIKKTEHWRIDAFELWCWRRLLRVPWTARRSNQSTLKEISLGCSLEGLMLKLRLQYFGHLMRRTNSFEKTLMLERLRAEEKGMTEDEMVGWHHWTLWTWVWVGSGVGDGCGSLACFGSWGCKELNTTEWLNWTELNWTQPPISTSTGLHRLRPVQKESLRIKISAPECLTQLVWCGPKKQYFKKISQASLVVQWLRITFQCRRHRFYPWS